MSQGSKVAEAAAKASEQGLLGVLLVVLSGEAEPSMLFRPGPK